MSLRQVHPFAQIELQPSIPTQQVSTDWIVHSVDAQPRYVSIKTLNIRAYLSRQLLVTSFMLYHYYIRELNHMCFFLIQYSCVTSSNEYFRMTMTEYMHDHLMTHR